MKYRLTRRGKLVVSGFGFILIAIVIIFISNLSGLRLDNNNSSIPDEQPQISIAEDDNKDDDASTADNTSQQVNPPAEPAIIEVKDNSDILKNMQLNIYFGPNISVIQEEYYEALKLFTNAANSMQGSIIQVEGNCATTVLNPDDEKNNSYNYSLSLFRAQAVADYLIKMGISSDRIIVIGNGSKKPIKSNDTPEGRKYNRRVDVTFKIIEG